MKILRPAKIALLIRVNTRKGGRSKWHMVLGLNPATDDILNLPSTSYCKAVNTRGLGPHGES